jgi:hypothetical protein
MVSLLATAHAALAELEGCATTGRAPGDRPPRVNTKYGSTAADREMLLGEAQVGRVSSEDIGEPGATLAVRPRWGLLGMLLSWWRVRISSGCPLAT